MYTIENDEVSSEAGVEKGQCYHIVKRSNQILCTLYSIDIIKNCNYYFTEINQAMILNQICLFVKIQLCSKFVAIF